MMILKTIGRYMAMRFITTILAVFFITFLLIFFADFVETLRRSASRDDIGALTMATISLLRVPVFAELALPFAILIGTIGAFLSFSRTSELIIIRASGFSVWQFIQPGLWVAVGFGIFAVTVFNPLASLMKAELERIQTKLFNTEKSFGTSRMTGSWLRQESVDGPTILHAKSSADRGLTLGGVTLLQFDLNNRFYEQIKQTRPNLGKGIGAWRTRLYKALAKPLNVIRSIS